MKKLVMSCLLIGNLHAMEDVENQLGKANADAEVILNNLATIVEKYGADVAENNDQFKTLVVQFFKKESISIEDSIMPHLKRRLRDSDSELSEVLEKDDKEKLVSIIDELVASSVEDAFNEMHSNYDELKLLADSRLKKSQYALASAIVGGVLSVLSVFFGVYFGRN